MKIKRFGVFNWLTLLLSLSWIPAQAASVDREIVVLTTFSQEPLSILIDEFKLRHPDAEVRFIHRRSESSIQLLGKTYMQDIDLVLSSSPFLMQKLCENERLGEVEQLETLPDWMALYVLPPRERVQTIGYSGAGIVWNHDYLQAHQLTVPNRFIDLTQPQYFGHITMSTPNRSGTTQMMVESILSRYGWQDGWRLLINIGANLATISSRSFGVSDYIAKGQFGLGPTIDSYALLIQRKFDHVGFSYESDFTLMPTYIAKTQRASDDPLVDDFMAMLLSAPMQASLGKNSFAKFSLHDTERKDGDHPTLNISAIMQREVLTNRLFDLAITKRLPELKDTWQTIIQLRKAYADNPVVLTQLESIRQLAFDIPVTETEVLEVSMQLALSSQQEMTDDGHAQAVMAEFSHRVSGALHRQLASANQRLQTLKKQGEE
ncbi:ABC transporter substrate-binding protein [Vibrio vulnificus]|uniref:ABC transporter substrate-binding protein n=1 Tax=Vibrio TaxID=662 RepID=UPI001F245EC1|nr:ABC transporter substrate-binding protein [Vibrio floridensis]